LKTGLQRAMSVLLSSGGSSNCQIGERQKVAHQQTRTSIIGFGKDLAAEFAGIYR
jgi:hypothetical protein